MFSKQQAEEELINLSLGLCGKKVIYGFDFFLGGGGGGGGGFEVF